MGHGSGGNLTEPILTHGSIGGREVGEDHTLELKPVSNEEPTEENKKPTSK